MATYKGTPDPVIGPMLIEMISNGTRMPEIYEMGLVARSTWRSWLAGDPDFAAAVMAARREVYFDKIESCPQIAADPTIDPKRARVIIHAIHEAAKMLDPDRYGARLNAKVESSVKAVRYELPAGATASDAARAYADFVAD